jgi:ketosteroid isomerase-like protein
MKMKLWLVFFFGLTLSVATAQSKQEKEVLDRLEMWRTALLEQDLETLDKVFANEMTYGHSNGHVDTKSSFINTIRDKKEVYKVLNLSDITVSIVGNNALVRNKMTGSVDLADGTMSKPNLGVLQVWNKTKNGWQLLARQAFKL